MTTQLTVQSVADTLEQWAPRQLAESWDNVGLLVGDPQGTVARIMTCLTITPQSAAEAIKRRAALVITHHPLPFRPLQKLTTETASGRMLLKLIEARVAIYSAHTAFDSAELGINQQLAQGLGLLDVGPLVEVEGSADQQAGSGRYGRLANPLPLSEFAARVRDFLQVAGLHGSASTERIIEKVAVACGSGGEFLEAALRRGCDCLVTGEARFHTCLEAEANGLALLLPGHFASERFAMEQLAEKLAATFSQAEVWASDQEAEPLCWMS